jgi:capsular polysaccharide transport system permease protein
LLNARQLRSSLSSPSPPLRVPGERPAQRTSWAIQRAVVYALFIREIRAQVEGRWLRLLWMLFEPVAHLAIVLLLFTFVRLLVSPGIDPSLFLVTGLVPFFMFRNLALRGADAARQSGGLFSYRQVKPFDTLVARCLVEVTQYSATYATLLATLAWLGINVLPDLPLELIGMSVVLVALGFGIALALMVACHDRPRLRSVVGVVFTPLYLLSGVIFPLHGLPQVWVDWLLLNPVLHLIELSRHSFVENYRLLDGVSLTYPAAWALALCALAMGLYRVNRQRLLASR